MILLAGRVTSILQSHTGRSVVCMFRPMKPRHIVVDVSIALTGVFLEFLVVGFSFSTVALVGMATALAFRRLSPTLALSIAWVTALVQVFFNIGPDTSNIAILPVLYATASYGSSFVKWAGLVSSGAGAFVITAYLSLGAWRVLYIPGGYSDIAQTLFQFSVIFFSALAAFTLSWTLGLLAKTWRNSRESTQARILAERARIDAQHAVVVEQERNRIARDMHDVVAHSLAVVIAQADGARYARESDPIAVDTALATIATTAREALGDVRILLGQLRHSQTEAPQPVLADLERLYDQLRGAGLPLRVEVLGTQVEFPMGVQLAVYRIVQEALTNVLRHGNTDQVTTVLFRWLGESLEIVISNSLDDETSSPTQRSESTTVPGHGLAGMTERAILVGGSLRAAPADGQFVVQATIPVMVSEVPV